MELSVKQIKEKYPAGTSVRLIKMGNDPRPVPAGTLGTVNHVDDMGTIQVSWLTGSSLGLIPGEDEFEVLRPTKVTLAWDNGTTLVRTFAYEAEAIVFVSEAMSTCKEKKWVKPTVTYEAAKVGDLPDADN